MVLNLIEKISQPEAVMTAAELAQLLDARVENEISQLHVAARQVKYAEVGPTVYLRGLIELSNICAKDCRYCGIRKSNHGVDRYQLELDEIVTAALWAHEHQFASLVLQGGERRNAAFVDYIEEALQRIHRATGNELRVTLSLGEQSVQTYQRWHDAGAHRYLLRIETTNPELYSSLHPVDHDHQERLVCLARLREVGFQTGTGVLMGLPGQDLGDLARDLLFFKDQDVDMIGMGPFIPHDDTPMASQVDGFDGSEQLRLGLNMIAVARLLLRNVNIASTTALEALAPRGRELGLLAGGNVVMPNLTPIAYRQGYQLYRGKPGLAENTSDSLAKLEKMVQAIGETMGYGLAGDAEHFLQRNRQRNNPE